VGRSPKALKDTDDLTVFFTLSGPTSIKASSKMLAKLTPPLLQTAFRDSLKITFPYEFALTSYTSLVSGHLFQSLKKNTVGPRYPQTMGFI